MRIELTNKYEPLNLLEEQESHISSAEKMQNALNGNDCFGFYLMDGTEKVGFALVRRWGEGRFFLWNFLVDCRYQGQGKGRVFLGLLMDALKNLYDARVVITT
ncbi:MAG: hypothetical protein FWB98_03510 [Defluviitaleaceae bacterium]|nr:hypothetical protein [Defluviitaleaceae bacterium]